MTGAALPGPAGFAASRELFTDIQSWLDGAASSELDHAELEQQLDTRGRGLFCQLLQDHLELRAFASSASRYATATTSAGPGWRPGTAASWRPSSVRSR